MAKQLKDNVLNTIAETSDFSVSDEMLRVTGQTGRRQVDCSRVAGRQQQTNDRQQ